MFIGLPIALMTACQPPSLSQFDLSHTRTQKKIICSLIKTRRKEGGGRWLLLRRARGGSNALNENIKMKKKSTFCSFLAWCVKRMNKARFKLCVSPSLSLPYEKINLSNIKSYWYTFFVILYCFLISFS